MTARTYTAAEMRDAFHRGRIIWGESRNEVLAVEEANRLWPDPAPEPPAMTVREEPDPDPNNAGVLWRWTPENGLEYHWVGPLPDGRPYTLKQEAKP